MEAEKDLGNEHLDVERDEIQSDEDMEVRICMVQIILAMDLGNLIKRMCSLIVVHLELLFVSSFVNLFQSRVASCWQHISRYQFYFCLQQSDFGSPFYMKISALTFKNIPKIH